MSTLIPVSVRKALFWFMTSHSGDLFYHSGLRKGPLVVYSGTLINAVSPIREVRTNYHRNSE